MLNAQFRPLDQWPGERTKGRRDAQFRATYPQTLDLLESELSHIHARAGSVIIQVDGLTLGDIRNDGWLRPQWKCFVDRPGVIVSFESPKGAISMPCDKFRDWQDNLRAIAKSLEALRMVDRYGVTRGNEQYRGWAKLEAPSNGKMTREQAITFMDSFLNEPGYFGSTAPGNVARACRDIKARYHPDHAKDEADAARRHEIFVKIGEAERVLCS